MTFFHFKEIPEASFPTVDPALWLLQADPDPAGLCLHERRRGQRRRRVLDPRRSWPCSSLMDSGVKP